MSIVYANCETSHIHLTLNFIHKKSEFGHFYINCFDLFCCFGVNSTIIKPSRKEYGLMVNYYARRGDMHRARETFEKMRARGIEPTSHVYTK